MTICILGVDPGLSGACAFFFPSEPHLISVYDMPIAGGEIDAVTLAQRIEQLRPDMCILERASTRPGQGISSSGKFMQSYGTIRGVIAALRVPLHIVTPSTWKGYFKLGKDKDRSRARALELWPASQHFGRVKDHNRAEAALLARYGAEVVIRSEAA